jgi:hypothetical protein
LASRYIIRENGKREFLMEKEKYIFKMEVTSRGILIKEKPLAKMVY